MNQLVVLLTLVLIVLGSEGGNYGLPSRCFYELLEKPSCEWYS